MIGKWQQFGRGADPRDGEAIVFIEHSFDFDRLVDGVIASAEFAIFRGGLLHQQNGAVVNVTPGVWWTSLPHPSARA